MLGAAATAVMTGILSVLWGRSAIVPGVVFGTLATAIQFGAVAVVRPVREAPFSKFMGRWGVGMGLRMGGVVLFLVAVLIDRELFPPVPSALAYLGVLIPLLFTEMRFLK
jgi:hypothetical protein